MKRVLFFLVLGLLSPLSALAQSSMIFDVDFGTNQPPHTPTVPFSGAILTNGLFSIVVYLDNTPPVSGTLLQLESGNSFSSITNLDLVFAGYGPPYSGTAFSYERAWNLSEPEMESLLAGHWFAEIAYNDTTYLGQILPVPEPTSLSLLAGGIAFVGIYQRKRSRREILKH